MTDGQAPILQAITIRKNGQITLPAELCRMTGLVEGMVLYAAAWPGERRVLLVQRDRLDKPLMGVVKDDLGFPPDGDSRSRQVARKKPQPN